MEVKTLIKDFIQDESGLTAVEYAVAGSLVAGAVVVAFTDLGTAVTNSLGVLEAAITPAP